MENNFSVSRHILSSVKWSTTSTGVKQVIQLIVMILLARNLFPEEFARASVALSITSLMTILAQIGLAPSIINSRREDKKFYDSINGILIFAGIIAYLLIYITTFYIDDYYKSLNISGILKITGISIIVAIIGNVPLAIIQKKLDFYSLFLVNVASSLALLLTTILMLMYEFGVWTIVLPPIISNFVSSFILCIKAGYKPWIAFDKLAIKESFFYGRANFFSQLLNFSCANIITLVMGKIWTPGQLGTYVFVESKTLKPYELITISIFSNLFPILARIKDDMNRIGEVYIKISRIAFYCFIPLYSSLIISTPKFIPLLFGPIWTHAIPLFQILFIVGIVRTFGFGANSLFYALNMPMRTWQVNLIRFIGYIILIFFTILFEGDIFFVSIGAVLIEALIGFLNTIFALDALGLKFKKYVDNLRDDLLLLIFYLGILNIIFTLWKIEGLTALQNISAVFAMHIFLLVVLLILKYPKIILNNLLAKVKN